MRIRANPPSTTRIAQAGWISDPRVAPATARVLGDELSRAYWEDYEAVRAELGYVDTLATLERFHARHPDAGGEALDRAILDFPYAQVRYPATLEVLKALRLVGLPVVLSDGDPVFQPLKVARSGVADAVGGNVLVFTHKDAHLHDVQRLFPAEQYVAIDDKASAELATSLLPPAVCCATAATSRIAFTT
jgi:hypothetical protein